MTTVKEFDSLGSVSLVGLGVRRGASQEGIVQEEVGEMGEIPDAECRGKGGLSTETKLGSASCVGVGLLVAVREPRTVLHGC